MRTRGGYWLSAQAIVAKRGGIHRDGGNSQGNFPISDKIGRRIGSASQAKIAKVVPSSVHANAWTRTIHRLSENWQFKNQVKGVFSISTPLTSTPPPESHFPFPKCYSPSTNPTPHETLPSPHLYPNTNTTLERNQKYGVNFSRKEELSNSLASFAFSLQGIPYAFLLTLG